MTLFLNSMAQFQQHKLRLNLIPVTPELFTIWKGTYMDKKQEEKAMKKVKQQQNAAGKNTSMSGRDLVSHLYLFVGSLYLCRGSSNTSAKSKNYLADLLCLALN